MRSQRGAISPAERRGTACLHPSAQCHERKFLEQKLRAQLRGIRGGIVLGRDFDDICTNDIETTQ